MRRIWIALALTCGVLLSALSFASTSPAPPTWHEFVNRWNEKMPGVAAIGDFKSKEDGYLVDFGYTCLLYVKVSNGAVKLARLMYSGGEGTGPGAGRFIRGTDLAINVGTHGLPDSVTAKVRATFAKADKNKSTIKEYGVTYSRSFDDALGWEFSITFD